MFFNENKKKRLHNNRVKFPEDLVGAPAWPPFLCLGAPTWRSWRHVKTENSKKLYCGILWRTRHTIHRYSAQNTSCFTTSEERTTEKSQSGRIRTTLRADSLSIFLNNSGRGRKTLPAASAFRIERALKIQTYSGVNHAWLVAAKPKNQNKQLGYFWTTLANTQQPRTHFLRNSR